MTIKGYYISMVKKARQSEEKAARWLRRKDFCILGRNRRFFGVEIDILARKAESEGNSETYYLVEVKSVARRRYEAGYPPLSYRQWERYIQAYRQWCSEIGKTPEVRFSLLIFDEKQEMIDFIPGYFWADAS